MGLTTVQRLIGDRLAGSEDESRRYLRHSVVAMLGVIVLVAGVFVYLHRATQRAIQVAHKDIHVAQVVEGVVESLARPGGTITGLSFLQAELLEKRLELLKEMVPRSTRIAALLNPAGPGLHESRKPLLHNLTVAARALELHLHVAELRRADELVTAFAAMTEATVFFVK